MDFQGPATLLEQAGQKLLKNEALAISALEFLPMELFPPLFEQAFVLRRPNILRTMVAAWPFPCLPVGSLMGSPDVEVLQAILDGLEMLLTQNIRPRRWKLRVVDLRDMHHHFWEVWGGAHGSGSSPQVTPKKPPGEEPPLSGEKQLLKVIADLYLDTPKLDGYHTLLLQWAQLRKDSLQLCFRKLQVWNVPKFTVIEVLKVCEADTIQELELSTGWSLSVLARFAPHLGRMRNLCKLFVHGIYKSTVKATDRYTALEKKCVTTFISQLPKLDHLQHLCMSEVYFLKGHLHRMLRRLQTSLETFSIIDCQLLQSDLNYLSICQSLSQLKHLTLNRVILSDLCLKPLGVLLERVATTLQSLDLEDCRMGDSQLRVLLPALSQCCQLTEVNFWENDISMPVLRDLLQHTAQLSQLTHELYPAPLECYNDLGDVIPERFAQICPELMYALKNIRQPKTISFATDICLACYRCCTYNLETRFCLCWQ